MSIASEISRLQNSKADVKTQVNIDKDLINGGTAFIASETLDDYDDCIEEMQDAYKKFIPIQSESGTTEVTIDNTGDTKALTSIEIDGNTTQTTYTGKQLLPFPYGETTKEENGITWTVNDDGSIKVKGTASNSSFFKLYNNTSSKLFTNTSKTYTLQIGIKTSSIMASFFDYINNSVSRFRTDSTFNNNYGITFTPSSTGEGQLFRLAVSSGAQIDVIIYPMIIEGSYESSLQTYEPYVGGIPSPSPSYPQPIDVVTGDNTVTVMNRNYINPTSSYTGTSNGISTTYNSTNQSLTYSGTASGTFAFLTNKMDLFLPAGDYTFLRTKSLSYTTIIRLYRDSLNYQDITILANTTSRSATVSSDIVAYQIYVANLTNGTQYNETDNYLFWKGSTSTTFEPYSKTEYPISLGLLELAKIGDYKDKIYKDDNDKKWYLRKEIGKVVLNGSENYSLSSGTGYYEFIYSSLSPVAVNSYLNAVTNYFFNVTTNRCISKNNELLIRIPTSENISTTDGFKTWLSTHNTDVYYILATTTDTEITDENLISQLEAIHFKTGINNISIDGDTAVSGFTVKFIGEASEHL